MTYSVQKLAGLRTNLAHICIGNEGKFVSLSDAIAWAHFKHDGLNYTYICLDNGDSIYTICLDGKSGFTEQYQKHLQENRWLEWSTKQYRLQVQK